MNQARVLCVSSDRSTRAALALSFSDTALTAVTVESSTAAIERLDDETFQTVVVDATTMANVPRLLGEVETRHPGTPIFVHWGNDESQSSPVVSEVIGSTETESVSDTLATAVSRRIETGRISAPDDVVGTVKRRLADARTPGTIERAIRKEFTADDRFGFAWIGEYDRGEREIVPWLTDRNTVDWPIHRTFTVGGGEQPVIERALHTREVQSVDRIEPTVTDVPLGSTAVDRNVQSVHIAPLATEDELYGVLVAYGIDTGSPIHREIVDSVAQTASKALDYIAIQGRLQQQDQTLRRYERLVDTAGDGMYVLDSDGHFTTVNDELIEMCGYTREGLLGEHVSLLLDEEGVDSGTETIISLLKSAETTDTLQTELQTKRGKTIPCEIQIAVLVHDEQYQGSVGIARDVTEQRRRERTLRQQNERLDAFARIVSHDLRNPLSVAQGYLDLLDETGSIQYSAKVREGLDRMETIIADVLAIARDGEWVATVEPVDLETVATRAWENVSTADATFVQEATMSLDADRSQLLRLFENLFRNAIEHGGSSVTVRVGSLTTSRGDSGFFVEDDGRGIPPKIREHAFESDYSGSSDGFGIGLWVVREVATGHGWTTVATESERGGARFEFVDDRS